MNIMMGVDTPSATSKSVIWIAEKPSHSSGMFLFQRANPVTDSCEAWKTTWKEEEFHQINLPGKDVMEKVN
jgi:hypothetical protein